MVCKAQEIVPRGDFRIIRGCDFCPFVPRMFDLVQSVFTFDNVPTREQKVGIFRGLRGLLK
jgi:hypothetical protein